MSAAKKHRIVIEVDPSQLFDAARMVGSMDAIGFRLSDPFMVGTMPSFADAMGLAFYGITVVNVSSADDADLSAERARTLAAARKAGLEEAAKIAEAQPFFPDTHTGIRQQWVKDQIAASIRGLAAASLPTIADPVKEEGR